MRDAIISALFRSWWISFLMTLKPYCIVTFVKYLNLICTNSLDDCIRAKGNCTVIHRNQKNEILRISGHHKCYERCVSLLLDSLFNNVQVRMTAGNWTATVLHNYCVALWLSLAWCQCDKGERPFNGGVRDAHWRELHNGGNKRRLPRQL